MLDKFKKMRDDYDALPAEEKRIKRKNNLIIIVGLFLASVVLSGSMVKSVIMAFTSESKGIIYCAFFNSWGRWITFISFIGLITFYFLISTRRKLSNIIDSTDERGVSYMKNASSGSSAWMNEKEARNVYNVGKAKDTDTTIYGQLTQDGKQVVSYKYPTFGGTGDQNLLLIGSPGTGKSYAYVRTEIIQSIVRGDSIVCTDPSGELQASMAKFAEDNGYNVQILNLLDPSYSNFWDCLSEVIDPNTERLDATRLNTFVNIYMRNCEDAGAKPDPFWFGASSNVLKATIGITSWERESYILNKFRELYLRVALKDPNHDEIAEKVMTGMASFVKCKELILKAAEKNGYDLEEVKGIIMSIERQAPKFNIGQVFNNLMVFKTKEGLVDEMPFNHPGKIAYATFSQSTEQVRQSTLMGMQLKMQLFSDDKITEVLSRKGIELSEMNRKKTIIFVIISDKSTELKPITSLFFSFFFKDVQDTWDKYQQIADGKGEANPCLKTTVMLDEFFSIGVIGGDPQSFGVTMSNSRKRQLHINIIVQGIKQLDALYGPDVASTIKTCCGTNLFLGCNDEETAKYVSEFMCGEATVLNERHAESQGIFGEINSKFNNVQFATTSRVLLTIEEAKSWKNRVLLSKRGEHPIRLYPFPWSDHPLASQIVKTNIYERMTRLDDKVFGLNEADALAKVNLNEKIKNLRPIDECEMDNIPEEKEVKPNEQMRLDISLEIPEEPKKKTKTVGKERGKEKRSKSRANSLAIKSNVSKSSDIAIEKQNEDMGSGSDSIL